MLKSKKEYKSSIPDVLDPIEILKDKNHIINILDLLGNKIDDIQTDVKGRILFLIGTKGIITMYWKSGCLFDYSSIGDVGKPLTDEALNKSISNPFIIDEKTRKLNK